MAMETDFLWDCKAKQIRLDMVPENRCFKGAVVFENKDGSNRICNICMEGCRCSLMRIEINNLIDVNYCSDKKYFSDKGTRLFTDEKMYCSMYGEGENKFTGNCDAKAKEIDDVINKSGFDMELKKIYKFAAMIVKNNVVMETDPINSTYKPDEIDWEKTAFLTRLCQEYDVGESEKNILRWSLEKGIDNEYVKMLAQNRYTYEQMTEILLGITDNHSREMIKMYSAPEFTHVQMSEISMGFSQGLTINQVKIYADPKFSSDQMHELRLALSDGLNEDQMNIICNHLYDRSQMAQLRLGFNMGLNIEDVMKYASPNFTSDMMNVIRKELKEDTRRKEFNEDNESYLCVFGKRGDEYETIDLRLLSEKGQFEFWKLLEKYSNDCETLTGSFKECIADMQIYDEKEISR